ncbi:uncharacterized protein NECHADRAFT_78292 [Fusarium vanettenii 77-13-4]|uniref:Uncharacterized protein n=1 Tax=Fusarium vanettenii (strain ATCC MYA-4622 / CBS 123669 / FGSC 9596 / NRRL 45880 / 77-13-4) TaxID=660122 RepID=C7ZL17_FUSV7|nr:uncharacterized protein NECHADRAFT_78292 [Fusarium vanettenii 77-13-4]EEU35298.1 predicted protein [Fusarium vanettenii 77-13-4]
MDSFIQTRPSSPSHRNVLEGIRINFRIFQNILPWQKCQMSSRSMKILQKCGAETERKINDSSLVYLETYLNITFLLKQRLSACDVGRKDMQEMEGVRMWTVGEVVFSQYVIVRYICDRAIPVVFGSLDELLIGVRWSGNIEGVWPQKHPPADGAPTKLGSQEFLTTDLFQGNAPHTSPNEKDLENFLA